MTKVRVPEAFTPGDRFQEDGASMWHVVDRFPETVDYRGTRAVRVETTTGRVLYCTPDVALVVTK